MNVYPPMNSRITYILLTFFSCFALAKACLKVPLKNWIPVVPSDFDLEVGLFSAKEWIVNKVSTIAKNLDLSIVMKFKAFVNLTWKSTFLVSDARILSQVPKKSYKRPYLNILDKNLYKTWACQTSEHWNCLTCRCVIDWLIRLNGHNC